VGLTLGDYVKFRRKVEMYQWKEVPALRPDGGENGGVTYTRVWSTVPIDSTRFRDKTHHKNSTHWPLGQMEKTADQVCIGEAYRLSPKQLALMDWYIPRPVRDEEVDNMRDEWKDYLHAEGRYLYWGSKNAMQPDVGDVRISYETVVHDYISIMGEQIGNTFTAWTGGTAVHRDEEAPLIMKPTDYVLFVDEGNVGPAMMIERRSTDNPWRVWMTRFVVVWFMFGGLAAVLAPFSSHLSTTPFFHCFAFGGFWLTCILTSLLACMLLAALPWLKWRPKMALSLLAAPVGLTVLCLVF